MNSNSNNNDSNTNNNNNINRLLRALFLVFTGLIVGLSG